MKYNVLVTGVGAVIGYGIVRSLKVSGYDVKVVGIDIYADAVGQVWCDAFEQGILASSDAFIPFVKHIVSKHRIDLVIPGIEQDVRKLSECSSQLNTKVVLNSGHLIKLCEDKWFFNEALKKEGFLTIPSFISGKYDDIRAQLGDVFLLKPRRSYASKGILRIERKEDYEYWHSKLGDNFMVQEIIGDDEHEYTVSAFGYGNGSVSEMICFKRSLSGEGATSKAEVVFIEEISCLVKEVSKFLKPVGPTNYQLRKHMGQYYFLEVNPRISSSTSIRSSLGFNEAKMCLEYYLQTKLNFSISIKYGKVVRYIEDCVL